MYVDRRGGRLANTAGRRCLCNALLATAGLPQRRPDGYTEPPIVTMGADSTGVRHLMSAAADGATYHARDVVAYLLGRPPYEDVQRDAGQLASTGPAGGPTEPAKA